MRKIVPNLRRDFKIFGPPGTGKTTTILKYLKAYLDYGFSPENLLLIGFARTTAAVLKERCQKEFGFKKEQIKAIRTIHSLCFKEFPEPKPKLLGDEQEEQFKKLVNLPVSQWPKANEFDAKEFSKGEEFGASLIEKKLKLIQRARTTFAHGDTWKSIEHYFDNHDQQEYNNIHKIIYSMKITNKLTFEKYDELCKNKLSEKLPYNNCNGDCIYFKINNIYKQRDNINHCSQHKINDLNGEYVLLSEKFYYFGINAINIPYKFKKIIPNGRSHLVNKNENIKNDFIFWLNNLYFEKNKIWGYPNNNINNKKFNKC